MKVTKTTELDRLKMIYPSSAENPIFEAMLFAEISVGVGNVRVVRFPRVAPLFLVLEASFAWRLSSVRVHAFSLSGRKERGNPGLKDTILSGLGIGRVK